MRSRISTLGPAQAHACPHAQAHAYPHARTHTHTNTHAAVHANAHAHAPAHIANHVTVHMYITESVVQICACMRYFKFNASITWSFDLFNIVRAVI